jgi:hypothetical protein
VEKARRADVAAAFRVRSRRAPDRFALRAAYGVSRRRRSLLVWPGRDQEVPQHLFHIFVVQKSVKELPQIGV